MREKHVFVLAFVFVALLLIPAVLLEVRSGRECRQVGVFEDEDSITMVVTDTLTPSIRRATDVSCIVEVPENASYEDLGNAFDLCTKKMDDNNRKGENE